MQILIAAILLKEKAACCGGGIFAGGNATTYEDFEDAIAINVAWSDDGSNITKVWKEICFREISIAIVKIEPVAEKWRVNVVLVTAACDV
jgi:hypothetical protein